MSVSLRNELGIGGLVSAHQDFCLFPARQNFPQQPGGVRGGGAARLLYG